MMFLALTASLLLIFPAVSHAQEINFNDLRKPGPTFEKSYKISGGYSDGVSAISKFSDVDTHRVERSQQQRASQGSGSNNCYNIKNDALKAYCLQGESACWEFGRSSNRDKFGIPRWVEDFCKSNYSIPDKALDDYYRSGYMSQFKDRKVYESAQKFNTDQSSRKRWVIHYANGYLLKSY